jgi:GNAT superfamily N-acetyltransferase
VAAFEPEDRDVRVEIAGPTTGVGANIHDPVVGTLTDLVNEAYATSEGSLWATRTQRISREAFAETLARGEIAIAWDRARAVGCIRVRGLDPTIYEFGVLAVSPDQRGRGVGDALVRFAEEHARSRGARTMELKLLEPLEGAHAFKVMLAEWYERLGYERVGGHPAGEGWPEAADELAVPCRFAVFQKPLR